MFSQAAKSFGAKTIELNLEKTSMSSSFDESYQGLAGKLVSKWVHNFLGS